MSFLHPTIRQFDLDTGHCVVREEFFRARRVRMIYVDGAMESAVYLDPSMRDVPPFYYQEKLVELTEKRPVESALLIGGGGFTYPRTYLKKPGRTLRVVEIEEKMLEIAREDLFFEDIYQEHIDKDLFVTIGDGFDFLRETEETYDLIINDAFSGSTQDMGLLMPDTAQEVYDHLNPGGTYLINLLASKTGEYSMPYVMQENILREIFPEVELIPVHPRWKSSERQNYIAVAIKETNE